MKLSTLTKQLAILERRPPQWKDDPDVSAICYDSRKILPGAVFVAIKGFSANGHRYISDAVERGAVAIVCQDPVPVDVPVLRVDDSRAALAALARRFYGNPAQELVLIGVTGTNGKTTVTYLLESILEKAGFRPGVVGTVNYRYNKNVFDNPGTTPESLELQQILRQMVENRVTHAVMEVSSHALDLSRVDGCRYDFGVFTNLTQDHLDYHGDMDRYWDCKKRLFADYLKPADGNHPVRAVANADDAKGKELIQLLGSAALSTSLVEGADMYPVAIAQDRSGIRGDIVTPSGPVSFDSPLVGRFNLENILSAVGAAIALGIDPKVTGSGIDGVPCVPGRLERISGKDRSPVFVDYAHTPDALENAIGALRPLTPGRLITVFGCGGDRDKSKRPVMGEIAARLSDLAIITSDNPRSEDPLAIISQVEEGVRPIQNRCYTVNEVKSGWHDPGYLVISDRFNAIETAIWAAKENDTVLVAGKGHETYQILSDKTIHFDDREAARTILTALEKMGA